ncbi:hypothetical protein DPMN_107009 [Dreissena polymorpha]|uniref:Reverse transcriptase domain-containing protein n=1 Tax=Dreissena polymorpha TaxID=45954 RepID=A0A9D4K6A5_DREPO|nr:hypothetical protein DPMN_107009 [Dreissena polymorpha]
MTGFKLGFLGPRKACTSPNLKSCSDFPQLVSQKIQNELSAGRIEGPFDFPPFDNLHVSPIGLVPKKSPGQYRLIHHLSYPKGDSINDFIDPTLATVVYSSFDEAVDLLLNLGPGTLFSKTDIDSAFRLIPIHPSDYHLLGFKFQEKIYFDKCLPMGASSSCAIFERFSTALHYASEQFLGIKHMVHILDDFLFLGPADSPICQTNLQKFLDFCSLIGVPIKSEKTENATPIITFMGLELDSLTMEARLPHDKLLKLRELLMKTSKSRKVTLKELQSLLGLLNFCCQVVTPGRSFLRRLTDLTKKVTNPNHHITLNKESRKDLHAWRLFADHFNGKSLLHKRRWLTSDTLHLHTDASGSIGFGAIFKHHWFSGTWSENLLPFDITFKELFPIVLAIEIWGHELQEKCIILHTDNAAVVHIINRQTCKIPHIMHLVRRLVLASMKCNILLNAEHIPGKFNILPDLLSRSQIEKFQASAPQMDKVPTAIPDHLLLLN